ncbi:MAG: hypothetical protein JWO88_3615 [Frankiales bacterium]|nr:hypothetical protein [Frankiales bacterium]
MNTLQEALKNLRTYDYGFSSDTLRLARGCAKQCEIAVAAVGLTRPADVEDLIAGLEDSKTEITEMQEALRAA